MRSLMVFGMLGGGTLLATLAGVATARPSESAVDAPAPRMVAAPAGRTEVAIFGGCFWGVEEVFARVKGVRFATSGYAGGTARTATYDVVSSGATRHAEAVRVVFDPTFVNYADLLRVFFSVVADPTTLNAQGPDHGPQYRTALFPQSPAQTRVAQAYIRQLAAARIYPRPIVTRIEGAGPFFPAEAYHQDSMRRNARHPYIVINDAPRIAALRRLFPNLYRT